MNRKEFDERAFRQREKGPMTKHQRIPPGDYRIGSPLDKEKVAAIALKACPLCGGKAEIKRVYGSVDKGGAWAWIECGGCGLELPHLQFERWKQGYGTFYADDDAVEVLRTEWNCRSPSPSIWPDLDRLLERADDVRIVAENGLDATVIIDFAGGY